MKDLTMNRMAEAHGTGLAGLAGKISSALGNYDENSEVKEMLEDTALHTGRSFKEVCHLASDLLAGYSNFEDSKRLRDLCN